MAEHPLSPRRPLSSYSGSERLQGCRWMRALSGWMDRRGPGGESGCKTACDARLDDSSFPSAVGRPLWSRSNDSAPHMVFTRLMASTLDTRTCAKGRGYSPEEHTCDRYCSHLRRHRSQKYARACLLQAITACPAPLPPPPLYNGAAPTDMCPGWWGCKCFPWVIASCPANAPESQP